MWEKKILTSYTPIGKLILYNMFSGRVNTVIIILRWFTSFWTDRRKRVLIKYSHIVSITLIEPNTGKNAE